MSMNPRGLLKVMGPLIERQAQKQTREHLQRFKQRMESPTSYFALKKSVRGGPDDGAA
jgi:hypothetical protein